MAEALGVAASILQIAGAGTKLSITLYNFVGSAARADHEINDIANDVEITANALESVGKVFEDEDSKSIVSIKAIQDARNLIKRCEAVFEEVGKLIDKKQKVGKDGKKSLTIVGKFSWPMKEQRVQLLRSRLESLKNSLGLLLHVLQLANSQAKGKLEKNALEEEKDKIRELHQRQVESQRTLQALESKLNGVSLDDDEETLSGSNVPSRIPTMELMVNPDPAIGLTTTRSKIQASPRDNDADSDTSDSDGTVTDDDGDHLTFDELANCAKHVEKLLKRISTLQQSFEAAQNQARAPRNRVHKLYRRFCQKFETDVFATVNKTKSTTLPLPDFIPPSRMVDVSVVAQGNILQRSERRVSPPVSAPPALSTRNSDETVRAETQDMGIAGEVHHECRICRKKFAREELPGHLSEHQGGQIKYNHLPGKIDKMQPHSDEASGRHSGGTKRRRLYRAPDSSHVRTSPTFETFPQRRNMQAALPDLGQLYGQIEQLKSWHDPFSSTPVYYPSNEAGAPTAPITPSNPFSFGSPAGAAGLVVPPTSGDSAKCKICGQTFGHPIDLKNHLEQAHPGKLYLEPPPPPIVDDPPFGFGPSSPDGMNLDFSIEDGHHEVLESFDFDAFLAEGDDERFEDEYSFPKPTVFHPPTSMPHEGRIPQSQSHAHAVPPARSVEKYSEIVSHQHSRERPASPRLSQSLPPLMPVHRNPRSTLTSPVTPFAASPSVPLLDNFNENPVEYGTASIPQPQHPPGGPRRMDRMTQSSENPRLMDYDEQLRLLEAQNKERLLMARQEQDSAAAGAAQSINQRTESSKRIISSWNEQVGRFETQDFVRAPQTHNSATTRPKRPERWEAETGQSYNSIAPNDALQSASRDRVSPRYGSPPLATTPAPPQAHTALQDYQMQLMLLEHQKKKRLYMARQERNSMISNPQHDKKADLQWSQLSSKDAEDLGSVVSGSVDTLGHNDPPETNTSSWEKPEASTIDEASLRKNPVSEAPAKSIAQETVAHSIVRGDVGEKRVGRRRGPLGPDQLQAAHKMRRLRTIETQSPPPEKYSENTVLPDTDVSPAPKHTSLGEVEDEDSRVPKPGSVSSATESATFINGNKLVVLKKKHYPFTYEAGKKAIRSPLQKKEMAKDEDKREDSSATEHPWRTAARRWLSDPGHEEPYHQFRKPPEPTSTFSNPYLDDFSADQGSDQNTAASEYILPSPSPRPQAASDNELYTPASASRDFDSSIQAAAGYPSNIPQWKSQTSSVNKTYPEIQTGPSPYSPLLEGPPSPVLPNSTYQGKARRSGNLSPYLRFEQSPSHFQESLRPSQSDRGSEGGSRGNSPMGQSRRHFVPSDAAVMTYSQHIESISSSVSHDARTSQEMSTSEDAGAIPSDHAIPFSASFQRDATSGRSGQASPHMPKHHPYTDTQDKEENRGAAPEMMAGPSEHDVPSQHDSTETTRGARDHEDERGEPQTRERGFTPVEQTSFDNAVIPEDTTINHNDIFNLAPDTALHLSRYANTGMALTQERSNTLPMQGDYGYQVDSTSGVLDQVKQKMDVLQVEAAGTPQKESEEHELAQITEAPLSAGQSTAEAPSSFATGASGGETLEEWRVPQLEKSEFPIGMVELKPVTNQKNASQGSTRERDQEKRRANERPPLPSKKGKAKDSEQVQPQENPTAEHADPSPRIEGLAEPRSNERSSVPAGSEQLGRTNVTIGIQTPQLPGSEQFLQGGIHTHFSEDKTDGLDGLESDPLTSTMLNTAVDIRSWQKIRSDREEILRTLVKNKWLPDFPPEKRPMKRKRRRHSHSNDSLLHGNDETKESSLQTSQSRIESPVNDGQNGRKRKRSLRNEDDGQHGTEESMPEPLGLGQGSEVGWSKSMKRKNVTGLCLAPEPTEWIEMSLPDEKAEEGKDIVDILLAEWTNIPLV